MTSRMHNLFGSSFCGVRIWQHWADLALWEEFLNAHGDVQTVVELGAAHGGMTLFLEFQAQMRGMRVYSFDLEWPVVLDAPLTAMLGMKNRFYQGDYWEDTNAVLMDLLHGERYKPLLLLVDGGDKPREFKALVPELAAGDYVAVHDWGREFHAGDVKPVEGMVEQVFWEECETPELPCLTRFWRRT